ncbi:MAG: SH3 domain-containing protein [Clostridia bacterium]|nr:SH3 domain-containing protein [Clostridia bacterium]
MIRAEDAIREARKLLGTPYAQLDCINLIKAVIRRAPGGNPAYTTAGTNALWRSSEMTAKYRDLTWRQDGLDGAAAGMIAFKADGADFHHAGIVTDAGTVIHSSSTQGGRGVVETPLTAAEGWTHLAIHRHIDVTQPSPVKDEQPIWRAIVMTASGALNLRTGNWRESDIIGTIPKGAVVDVLETGEDMWRVAYGGVTGWAASEYLSRHTDASDDKDDAPHTALIRDDGTTIILAGRWRVADD